MFLQFELVILIGSWLCVVEIQPTQVDSDSPEFMPYLMTGINVCNGSDMF